MHNVIIQRPSDRRRTLLAVIVCTALLAACAESARLPLSAGIGAQPTLPPPRHTLLPTVNIAPAQGWPEGGTPLAAAGLRVQAFARELDHPRWLLVLPNGDVLVAESNAPPKPDDSGGIKGWVKKLAMKRAGAGTPSANRITLLRDSDGDGVADQRHIFLSGLNSPFGMALVGEQLFVANTDAVLRFPYRNAVTRIDEPGTVVTALPAGTINHHWTKNLIASSDGRTLYVTVGSNSNVAERGMAAEAERAAVWAVDVATGAHRLYATGLRNPNGLAWVPSGSTTASTTASTTVSTLWTVVNERDELGSDLVPDYLTSLREGAFYGWPYSYYGKNVDTRVQPARPDLVARAVVPDYALGSHTAPLGLAWSAGTPLAPAFAQGMFIGQHGSWNRKPHSGYEVVFVPFDGARPSGAQPLPVLSGFLSPQGKAYGRPVGVALDRSGALLVADDVGNVVWRVSPQR